MLGEAEWSVQVLATLIESPEWLHRCLHVLLYPSKGTPEALNANKATCLPIHLSACLPKYKYRVQVCAELQYLHACT